MTRTPQVRFFVTRSYIQGESYIGPFIFYGTCGVHPPVGSNRIYIPSSVWSLDVTQASVYSRREVTCQVFVQTPKDLKVADGVLLCIAKPLFGLADAGDYWHRTLVTV